MKLSLPALETLAVIAYKQPVTAPEVNEIRGVDSSGVFGSLLARKLITTAGRKQVIGRPILYKTTKEFLMRFGLKDVAELPSMEEFEKMAASELEMEPEVVEADKAEQTTPKNSRKTLRRIWNRTRPAARKWPAQRRPQKATDRSHRQRRVSRIPAPPRNRQTRSRLQSRTASRSNPRPARPLRSNPARHKKPRRLPMPRAKKKVEPKAAETPSRSHPASMSRTSPN